MSRCCLCQCCAHSPPRLSYSSSSPAAVLVGSHLHHYLPYAYTIHLWLCWSGRVYWGNIIPGDFCLLSDLLEVTLGFQTQILPQKLRLRIISKNSCLERVRVSAREFKYSQLRSTFKFCFIKKQLYNKILPHIKRILMDIRLQVKLKKQIFWILRTSKLKCNCKSKLRPERKFIGIFE